MVMLFVNVLAAQHNTNKYALDCWSVQIIIIFVVVTIKYEKDKNCALQSLAFSPFLFLSLSLPLCNAFTLIICRKVFEYGRCPARHIYILRIMCMRVWFWWEIWPQTKTNKYVFIWSATQFTTHENLYNLSHKYMCGCSCLLLLLLLSRMGGIGGRTVSNCAIGLPSFNRKSARICMCVVSAWPCVYDTMTEGRQIFNHCQAHYGMDHPPFMGGWSNIMPCKRQYLIVTNRQG